MEKVCVFLADGFEEGEALIPVDLLRRAGAEVTIASISASLCVQGCARHLCNSGHSGGRPTAGGIRHGGAARRAAGHAEPFAQRACKAGCAGLCPPGKVGGSYLRRARPSGRMGAFAGAARHMLSICGRKMHRRRPDRRARCAQTATSSPAAGWVQPSHSGWRWWGILPGRPKAPASERASFIYTELPMQNARRRLKPAPHVCLRHFPSAGLPVHGLIQLHHMEMVFPHTVYFQIFAGQGPPTQTRFFLQRAKTLCCGASHWPRCGAAQAV